MAVEVPQEDWDELARLRSYQALAEYNLEQMGLTLQEAEARGWVTKRAGTRRAWKERRKAIGDAEWEKLGEDKAWVREQQKRVGLPVDDSTPAPSEVAYRERVAVAAAETKAERIQSRVQRTSHQLLIAAAMGKQYRELTTADHFGHVVRSAGPIVPLKYRPFDARSDTSVATTSIMARSFRNWGGREKAIPVRSRSNSPEPMIISGRTTGPEDSSFAEGNVPMNPAVAGATAFRAIVSYPSSVEGDDSDLDDDDEFKLTNLDPNDVSDEIVATAYAMLVAAQEVDDGKGDWADILANDILGSLLYNRLSTPPSSIDSDMRSDSDSDSDTSDGADSDERKNLSQEVETALKLFQISPIPKVKEIRERYKLAKVVRNPVPAIRGGKGPKSTSRAYGQAKKADGTTKTGKSPKKPPAEVETAVNYLQQQQVPTPSAAPATPYKEKGRHKQVKRVKKSRKRGSSSREGPPRRRPNRPAAPCRSIYDPTWWRVNNTDADDGVWARKPAAQRQPAEKDKTETGFVKWAEQERRFPHLDDALRLDPVRGGTERAMFFDRATVDSRVWDPLNRTIVEPRTGSRAPLHLNPVTTHSLARWHMSGPLNHLHPLRLPDNPPTEDKKRPLPSATLVMPRASSRGGNATVTQSGLALGLGTGTGTQRDGTASGRPANKRVTFDSVAKVATPTKRTPMEFTSQDAPVASVRYPLKSPVATSISRSHAGGLFEAAAQNPTPSTAGFGNIKASPPGPPTPYPRRVTATPTPTVALYERATPQIAEGAEVETGEEEDQRLAAFLEGLHAGQDDNKKKKKRPATAGSYSAGLPTPKRRAMRGGFAGSFASGIDSEKENATTPRQAKAKDKGPDAVYTTTPETWSPVAANRRRDAGEKKSVRFQLREGPSRGMRYGARRALGRLGLTSVRRGPFV